MVVRRDRRADEKPLPRVYPKKAMNELGTHPFMGTYVPVTLNLTSALLHILLS